MTNVVSLDERSWNSMLQKSEKYLPIIERLVGFFLLHDHRTNEDHDPFGTIARATVPGLGELSDIEEEFVRAGAMHIYYQYDPGHDIREIGRSWVMEGGPS